jgi:hypothetical protein
MRTIARTKIFRDFSASDRPQASKTGQDQQCENSTEFSHSLPSGDLAALPSGSTSSLLRAAILFAAARNRPTASPIKTSGRGEGQGRERVSALLLSCARQPITDRPPHGFRNRRSSPGAPNTGDDAARLREPRLHGVPLGNERATQRFAAQPFSLPTVRPLQRRRK